MANTRAYLAEFLGTFVLCFGAIGAVLSATQAVGRGGGLVAIALGKRRDRRPQRGVGEHVVQ